MTQFARDFVSSIKGASVDISTKELSGGARIFYIFNDVFGSELADLDATANLGDQDIRTAIRSSTGPRSSSFVPEVALICGEAGGLSCLSLRVRDVWSWHTSMVKIFRDCTIPVSSIRCRTVSPPVLRATSGTAEVPWLPRPSCRSRFGVVEGEVGTDLGYTQNLIDIPSAYINCIYGERTECHRRSHEFPKPNAESPPSGQ